MEILRMMIDGASSIGWGILIAIAITSILYLIIYSIQGGDKKFSLLSFVVAPFLVAALSYQCSLLVGGMKMKKQCNYIATTIDALVPPSVDVNQWLSDPETRSTVKGTVSMLPIVGEMIDVDAIANVGEESLGEAVVSQVSGYLNWFIVRRIGWSMLFCVIGAIAVFFMLTNKYQGINRRVPRTSRQRVSRGRRR